jgi:hypothetical protein
MGASMTAAVKGRRQTFDKMVPNSGLTSADLLITSSALMREVYLIN